MKIPLLIIPLVTVIACGGPKATQIMVNPMTGHTVMVETYPGAGYGLAGIASALHADSVQRQRVKALEDAGYIRIQDLGTTEIHLPKELSAAPVVQALTPGGPAALAGVKVGDLMLEYRGIKIKTVGELRSQPRPKAGEVVDMKFERDGKTIDFQLTAVPMSK